MIQETLTTGTITTAEFHALLSRLQHDLLMRIRVRPIGQMWHRSFSPVLRVVDTGAILMQDGDEMTRIQINNIIQFEIEGQFHGMKPNSHYNFK